MWLLAAAHAAHDVPAAARMAPARQAPRRAPTQRNVTVRHTVRAAPRNGPAGAGVGALSASALASASKIKIRCTSFSFTKKTSGAPPKRLLHQAARRCG